MGSSGEGIRRRIVLFGVGGGIGFLAGCSGGEVSPSEIGSDDGKATGTDEGGSEFGGSVTHGGVTVTVTHHVINTQVLQYDDDGNPCIELVVSDKVRLLVSMNIDSGDADVPPHEIVEGLVLRCNGESYEVFSVSFSPNDNMAGERVLVGFEVPEDIDTGSCELELAWQGNSSSSETFQFGLGPEQESEVPEDVPLCQSKELRESFEVRVRNSAGEERGLHGVDAIARSGPVKELNGMYGFTVRYFDEAAETVVTRLKEFGTLDNPSETTVLIELEGNVVSTLEFTVDLVEEMKNGNWLEDPRLRLSFGDREEAKRVRSVIEGEL